MQTPSGKIEVYSESLKAIGLPALPTHMPLVEESDYPLLYVSAPNHNFMNSTFSNNEKHVKLEKAPQFISVEDAEYRGITDGMLARVWTGLPIGAVERRFIPDG